MQNYGDSKARGHLGLRGRSGWSAEDFEGSGTSLCDTVMAATGTAANPQNAHRQSEPECHPQAPVTMPCRCRFIRCNKCPTPVGVMVMGEAVHVRGQGNGKSL